MASARSNPERMDDGFAGGMTGAVVLHVALIGALVLVALYSQSHRKDWGEDTSTVGAIQASLVSAIPLPPKAPPIEKAVLASEDESKVPEATPKEKAAPPPKPTDVLIKARTSEKPPLKTAPTPTEAPPKHPQPTPPTPKAAAGDAAPQLPQSAVQMKNGAGTLTIQSKTFGTRYAYYLRIVANKVQNNYFEQDIDGHSALNKSAVVVFDILRDGSVANLKLENASGSSSLDGAAMHTIQRIDSFGPLPEGDRITIEYKFDYHSGRS